MCVRVVRVCKCVKKERMKGKNIIDNELKSKLEKRGRVKKRQKELLVSFDSRILIHGSIFRFVF